MDVRAAVILGVIMARYDLGISSAGNAEVNQLCLLIKQS